MGSELRQRNTPRKISSKSPLVVEVDSKKNRAVQPPTQLQNNAHTIAKWTLTVFAFVTRFFIINYPDEVVFDEVHFGKFASYYIEGTYFFDLHPPFAKLLIAAVGSFIGYDGSFKFDNIGDSYITNNVPYVAYRSLSATLGALTVPLVFNILQESGYSVWSCVIGASLILFDNAHIAETRLILLDATLIFSIAASIYSYVRFSKERNAPFSRPWWKWLLLTGVSLSCVVSTKYVGVFTFLTIGSAVLIDLWNLLDYKKGLTLRQFGVHFLARFFGLIVVPFGIFLFWFWVHFAILTKSGPGDDFMSPEFQETLGDNILARESKLVNFYDHITIRHKDTRILLSSNEQHYPLRYDDGRVSSQGQIVTGVLPNIEDNVWQILPELVDMPENEQQLGREVPGGARIRLKHIATDNYLVCHDVASPYFPTNEEFTAVTGEEALGPRYNDTIFELRMVSGGNEPVKTKGGYFRFIHVATNVALWTHNDKTLPEWAPDQYEVNGNKNILETSNIWYINEIVGLRDPDRLKFEAKQSKHVAFFKKYWELQMIMFAQNNALTSSHPYASEPISWPFLLRGVSFWTKDPHRTQIYFVGNFMGWWLEVCMISVFLGIVLADQLTRRRNFYPINNLSRSKIYNSLGFFFIAWVTHYFPFFLMGRQKFLHHYLPAHLLAALLTGGIFDFIFGELDDEAIDAARMGRKNRNLPLILATAVILVLVVACFVYFAPLTYGWPGLEPHEVRARQLMNIELHFAK
jgi:dolichyl-phosphate-mannose-protein mannosyltransferase